MSSSDVTREGIRGARDGRSALVGAGLGDADRPPEGERGGRRAGGGRGKRRGGRAEQPMVPEADVTSYSSYYGRPVLNPPTWEARDIAGYFFLGGLAGAGSVLAAGAELTRRPAMARALKVSSLVAISGSAAALVHDLGRPGRFGNMLRVFKPTSPMSMGSWLLAGYGPAAGAAALSDVTGLLPVIGRAATFQAAALGPAVATYTAVLAADTAVPAWHDGYRELPFVFAGSAVSAASGMALVAAPPAGSAPARSTAVFGGALELAATTALERRLGMVARAYRTGRAGRLMRAAKALSIAGTAGAVLGRRSRVVSALSGTALLAASACTRLGVFHAGVQSAEDPRYTVVPQRERLRERGGRGSAEASAEAPAEAPGESAGA